MYISAGDEAERSAKTSGCQPDYTCVRVRVTERHGRFIYLFIYFFIFFPARITRVMQMFRFSFTALME